MSWQAVVTLTAIGGGTEGPKTRVIKLNKDKQSVRIGRSSHTKSKNIESGEDNAWLDSPVVSRTHAELRLVSTRSAVSNSYSDDGRPSTPLSMAELVLIDLDSMHGTFMNDTRIKLDSHREVALKNDTLITFGTEVIRNAHIYKPQRYNLTFDITPTYLPTPESRSPHVIKSGYGITEEELCVRSESDDSYEADYVDDDGSDGDASVSELYMKGELVDLDDDDDDDDEEYAPYEVSSQELFDDSRDDEVLSSSHEPSVQGIALTDHLMLESDCYVKWDFKPVQEFSEISKNGTKAVWYDSNSEEDIRSEKETSKGGDNECKWTTEEDQDDVLPRPPMSRMNSTAADLIGLRSPDITKLIPAVLDAGSQTPTSGQRTSDDTTNEGLLKIQSRSRITIDNILNSEEEPSRKRKIVDISVDESSLSVPSLLEEDFPDAQPRDSQSSGNPVSIVGPTPPTPAEPPSKRAKIERTTSGFLRTAATALVGVAVGAVGVFAALAASAPADI